MYGFEGVGLSEVQLSISELSVVGGWWVGGAQTHFMVGPGRGPTKTPYIIITIFNIFSGIVIFTISIKKIYKSP